MINKKFILGVVAGVATTVAVEATAVTINWFSMKRKIKKEMENLEYEDIQEEVEKELEKMINNN